MGVGRQLLDKWVRMVEFPESIPNFFQNCREVGILLEGEVGDILGSVKDSTKDFGLEGLYVCDIGRFG
jgi:hypothetical protein